jgi:TFIIF-interacting CTD phosphatase-like protein
MHIVLDLDETLISASPVRTKEHQVDFKFQLDDGSTYYVSKRPGLPSFLSYVFKRFESVSIWTAATSPYAHKILSAIMTPEQFKRLKFFYTRDRLRHEKTGKSSKPLAYMFSDKNAQGMKACNTVMIDDRESVAIHNPGNLLVIPTWNPWKGTESDTWLYKLTVILEGLLQLKEEICISDLPKSLHIDDLVPRTPPASTNSGVLHAKSGTKKKHGEGSRSNR